MVRLGVFSGLSNFFDWFVDLFTSLADFVVSFVSGILRLLKLIPTAVSFLTDYVSALPPLLTTFAGVTVTVTVIFLIVGRDSGGGN